MRIYLTIISLFFLLLTSAACRHTPIQVGSASLQTRVASFWDTKVQKDWNRTYNYFCKNYQDKTQREDFVKSSNLDIIAFEVISTNMFDSGRKAMVLVKFDVEVMGFKIKDIQLEEEWIHEERTWCVCPKSNHGFKKMFQKQ